MAEAPERSGLVLLEVNEIGEDDVIDEYNDGFEPSIEEEEFIADNDGLILVSRPRWEVGSVPAGVDTTITLEAVLARQLSERNKKYNRNCPICGSHPQSTSQPVSQRDIFSHMFTEHHFNMGHPDNLVFVPELLDYLEKSLQELKCIYCEKLFKSRHILKEHMRKKRHYRIHPKNPRYDRFYIVNYTSNGFLKKPASNADGTTAPEDDAEDENWEDWVDDDATSQLTPCLFCEETLETAEICLQHMKSVHNFDLAHIRKDQKLDFYQTVRLVNLIRGAAKELKCAWCSAEMASRDDWTRHILACPPDFASKNHSWKSNDMLLVPVLADDRLLTGFLDSDSEEEEDA